MYEVYAQNVETNKMRKLGEAESYEEARSKVGRKAHRDEMVVIFNDWGAQVACFMWA